MYAASGSSKRFVTGFPYIANWTLVEFRREPPADRVCSLCGVLAGETLRAPCKHVFCRRCFQGLATGELVVCCPVDGTDFGTQQVRLDRTAPDVLRHYPVGCKNKGCLHVPTLASYEKHIALCEHQLVLCELCSRRLQVSQVLSHVRTECRKVASKGVHDASRNPAALDTVGAVGGDARVDTPHADRCEMVSQELKSLRMTIHEELLSFRTALQEARASLAEGQLEWRKHLADDETAAQHLMMESVGDTLSRELGAVEEDSPPSSCYVWKVVDFARMRQDALEGRTTSVQQRRLLLRRRGLPRKTSFVLISNVSEGTYNIQGDIRPESEGEEWGHCFRKPRPGEDNEGFGFSQFITLEDLANPEYGYIKDNAFTIHFLTQLRV
ncbi:hypothetical protein HPB51_002784 [Rhipicephalus microplus]|uniref:RING-type domain-containing protein n=1 Tax=Rhipicephalus microplus TaxID=6941 RepID=A0A9J6EXG9_RHIMP|nr:hypothetical protein HPB51_002784 [Rhipicephalus microplus]